MSTEIYGYISSFFDEKMSFFFSHITPIISFFIYTSISPSLFKKAIFSSKNTHKYRFFAILFILKEPQVGPEGPLGSSDCFSELSGHHRSPGLVPQGLQSVGLQQGPLAESFFSWNFLNARNRRGKCPRLANSARDKKRQILPVEKIICPWPCLEIVTSTFRDSRAVFCQSPWQIWLFCWKCPWLLPLCPWQFQNWWRWKFGTGPWNFLKRCQWTSENARDKFHQIAFGFHRIKKSRKK